MNTAQVKLHIQNLLAGTITTDEVLALGTPEAQEAVTVCSRNFNDITHHARDIAAAMNGRFIAKIKAGPANFHYLVNEGCIEPAAAIKLLGKTLEFRIDWAATLPDRTGPWLYIITSMPNGINGYRIPVGAIVQDFDAKQCRRINKWVRELVKKAS